MEYNEGVVDGELEEAPHKVLPETNRFLVYLIICPALIGVINTPHSVVVELHKETQM